MREGVQPVRESKRLIWIDAARGLAIFGIFIVNIGAFSSPYFLYGNANEVWTSSVDQFVLHGIDIFFQASFYTLFSLLFGFGLGIMKERLTVRGENLYAFLMRRFLILLGFGLIHAFLLWHGDILVSYALIGMVSLLFLHMNTKTKVGFGVLLLIGSVSFISSLYYLTRDFLDLFNEVAVEQAFNNYQSKELSLIWLQNYEDWIYTNNLVSFIFLTLVLLPLFLFGLFLAEKRWLHEPKKYKSILMKIWVISLFLFLGFKMGPYAFGNPTWFSYAQDNIGGMFSAIFYIVSVTLLAGTSVGKKIIQPFTYVGRMALTNYVLQSIISFLLFYGIGFGLYGSISPIEGVAIVLIIYTCQIVWSKWWFRRFKFGPLEWVWRSLTYGKRQPFKK